VVRPDIFIAGLWPAVDARVGWRWLAALTFLVFALAGLASGVGFSERPGVDEAGWAVMTYYSLGLFVFGGLDIGFPVGGPLAGRTLLWISYFGAPLLAASTLIEALMRVMWRDRWHLRRLTDHIVVVGAGSLTLTYLRVLRRRWPVVPVVVLADAVEPTRRQELEQAFNVRVLVGDPTHEFMLRQLRLRRARRIVLLPDDNFEAFEAASKMLHLRDINKGEST
jgi:hypothetical protein